MASPSPPPSTATGTGGLGRAFGRLLAGSATSNLADGLVLVGAPLLAISLTRDPRLVAGVQVAATLPWLLLALTIGAVADRRAARDLLVGAAALRAAILAGVGIAAVSGAWSLPLLYLAVVAFGVGEVVGDTTSQTLVPQLVSTERLGTANGRLIAAQATLTNVAGAPLAGLLVGVGAAVALLGPAALYLAAGLVFLSLPERYRPARRPATTLRHDVAEGIRTLWQAPALRGLAVLGSLLNLASTAYFSVFVLFVVGEDAPMGRSEVVYGGLAALLAVGSLIGAWLAGRLERWFGPRRVLLGGMLALAGVMTVPLVTAALVPIGGMVLLLGTASLVVNVVSVSSRQRAVPRALLGRVNATFRLMAAGMMPLGALLGGFVTDAFGLRTLFGAAVVVQLVAVAACQGPICDNALRPAAAV